MSAALGALAVALQLGFCVGIAWNEADDRSARTELAFVFGLAILFWSLGVLGLIVQELL